MQRIYYLFTLALGMGSLAAAVAPPPAQSCPGGSVIYDSTTNPRTPVGCLFPNWGPAEQAQCQGRAVIGPSNSGTCHICVQSQYASLVTSGDYLLPTNPSDPSSTRLTLDQYAMSWIDGVHTPFRCLGCANPPLNMAAWWKLDEWAGMPVKDAAGNLPDGVRYGTIAVPGRVGGAAWFNGVSDRIEVPNSSAVDVGPASASSPVKGNFSIDAWVKIGPLDNTSGVRVIAEKRAQNYPATGRYMGYSFFLYYGNLSLQLADGTKYNNYVSALNVPQDGQWHLVAVSVDRALSSTLQFYADGTTAVVSSALTQGSLQNPNPLRIGMVTINNYDGAFSGSIDEVEFFNRSVIKTEFDSIYKAKGYGKCNASCSTLLSINESGTLYNINTKTGAATNPRGPNFPSYNGAKNPYYIAYSPDGKVYGLGAAALNTQQTPSLYTVNPMTGVPTNVGDTGVWMSVEGDLAFDPTTGILYGVDGVGALFTFDTQTGAGKLVGSIPYWCNANQMDLSAMAFDSAGNLFVVDTMNACLLKIDKSSAKVISSIKLSAASQTGVAGLAFDPATGTAYFAGQAPSNLFALDVVTGAMTPVGPLNATSGYSVYGLTFVPAACPVQ